MAYVSRVACGPCGAQFYYLCGTFNMCVAYLKCVWNIAYKCGILNIFVEYSYYVRQIFLEWSFFLHVWHILFMHGRRPMRWWVC